jgi:hypothetical protein
MCFGHCVFGLGRDVRNLNDPTLKHGSARRRSAARSDRSALEELLESEWEAKVGRRLMDISFTAVNESHLCIAQSCSRLDQPVQHRLQIEGRALMTLSTSAVAVCCCKDSRSSFRSRVFSMAMTAWASKGREDSPSNVAALCGSFRIKN